MVGYVSLTTPLLVGARHMSRSLTSQVHPQEIFLQLTATGRRRQSVCLLGGTLLVGVLSRMDFE